MINKFFPKFFGLVALVALTASCNDDEDIAAQVNTNKPTMTIEAPAALSVTEGDVIPFTLTLSKPVGEAFTFYVVYQIQGSTADDSDTNINQALGNTTFQRSFRVPPFVTTFSGQITINDDDIAEDTETLVLSIGDSRTSAVIFTPVISTITIANKVSDELNLTIDWDAAFNLFGTDYTLCGLNYDVDVLVFDANGDPVGDGAQTADCPENLVMNINDFPNGTYDVVGNLFDEADLSGAGISPPLDFPVTITYQRAGSVGLGDGGSFVQTDGFTSDDPDGTLIYLCTVEVNNGVFTIKNDATTIAQGKAAVKNKKFHTSRKK